MDSANKYIHLSKSFKLSLIIWLIIGVTIVSANPSKSKTNIFDNLSLNNYKILKEKLENNLRI